ncbi:YbdK family carboxylate-amine ligase [Legionella maioricensis]|uniref:Putative glutamate--cysteine ligase 2 n=1 Tax=Legionella maioricensis TaxID=2896528 RepID=A0A9X2CZ91_9GAMM|nr:YbdK family carboxylate-amine ligase [Legionella maioricensis]MCL9683634.1 YbdK family carboxylate-amine ligase [Legionella maioricensis]MCL9687656.1 YbdK family carboxylate-amine ligase [Legionella maioricensis]
MRRLSFKKSSVSSIGIELELQLVDPYSFTLISRAKDIIRGIKSSLDQLRIKPEITQSMIEINSSIHHSPQAMIKELYELRSYLIQQANNLNLAICGGGTHPFQTWAMQKIFPTMRYRKIAQKFTYLSKMATVFGQHIHIGCANAEDSIYLTHALSRYVPQLIALTASSPFYQGVDTGFYSCRTTVFNAFPLSGVIPYLTNWNEFSDYFHKMRRLGIITSMKDFYWDIRPKPEFGTVEIRVCDTPLTIKKAVLITAYIQTLALYLLEERPTQANHDLYYLYSQNRFEACRYGFEGNFINPFTMKSCSISEDILVTAKIIEKYAQQLGNTDYISQLLDDAVRGINDAFILRQTLKQVGSLPELVAKQCDIWSEVVEQ